MKTLSEIRAIGLTDEEIQRHLSPMILSIARATTLETAFRFAEEFSSRQIYLPNGAEGWKFSEIVGLADAVKIIDLLGGSRMVEIPSVFGNRLFTRLKGIAMLRDGASINDVCMSLGVSRCTVKTWRKNFVVAGP